MAKSARKPVTRPTCYSAKSQRASGLRRRKHVLARHFGIPADLLGGSLKRVFRQCGNPNCHCASDDGHPMWTLSYSVKGRRRVEFIPDDLLPMVQPLTNEGGAYRDALREILTINAQLVTLWRKQRRSKKPRRNKKKR